MKIAIVGDGRMAQAIATEARAAGDQVVSILGLADNANAAGITATWLGDTDVVFEFTTPASVVGNLHALKTIGARVICGTTGWDAERTVIESNWRSGPGALLAASNFSLGVHLFLAAARTLAAGVASRPEFDGFVHERHHAAKLDAPSGTAKSLQQVLRSADAGREWPATSVRAGSIPGEHEVVLDGPFESITLRHVARDRRVFASGALTAARWLKGRQGLFTIEDMLRGV